jgi:dihydrodipicolinate reductase
MKVAICGANGRMGRELVKAVLADPDLDFQGVSKSLCCPSTLEFFDIFPHASEQLVPTQPSSSRTFR